MKDLKKFTGSLVIFAVLVWIGCKIAVFFESINSLAGTFLWIAVVTAYCVGYGMHALDAARAWPAPPTDRELDNVVVRSRQETAS
jgi:hypothetical protein